MKRSLLIESILEVPWVHCNGLYEMNTCSYGFFIKVVTFMRAFCNLIVKLREKCTKSRTAHSGERSSLFKGMRGVHWAIIMG